MHVCMASSTIQTAGNCLNLSMAADHDEEVILHFGSMKLKQDGTIRVPVAASQINVDASPSNSDSFSVFSFKTQEEHAPNPTTFKNIETPCVLAQDNSPTHDDILGPRYFMTGVDEYMSEAHNIPGHENLKGSMGHQHWSLDPHAPENLASRSSIGQPTVNSLYDHPSTSNFFHQFSSRQLLYGDPRRLHFLYSMLIDACEGQQLDSLVERVLSQGEYFVSAAFCKQGVSSIIKLIRKVKRSPHAFAIARLLSSRFMDIMTHPTARNVIVQCLVLFRSQTNENLLSLRNTDITNRITGRLQNQFIRLSMIKGGSHVVEKCMEASDNGILAVVEEILDCPKAPFQLVRDQFGNYIIQTALKKTKEQGFNSFYNALVRRLEPHRRAICRTAGGKNVLSIVES
ncbi:UNVERIFIED_CONTAM: hypothetical protein Sradi_2230600 [Sesamum radiatum]|uniref:PUM-HD domain-containing protein n=1 Tax=Sesamum radiatum TaxID=300843 RepID=A0AAW2T2F2_SESRA